MSGDQKESVLSKSYHYLFLLYAPVALGGFVLKFFSGVTVDLVLVSSAFVAATSLLIFLLILALAFKHRKVLATDADLDVPFPIRHRFLITFMCVAIISLVSMSYGVHHYHEARAEKEKALNPTEIVLLFHISNELGRPWGSVIETIKGYSRYFIDHPEATGRYHVTFVDHQNKYDDRLKELMRKEMERGVKYFMCLTSQACVPLSKSFDSIVREADVSGRKPVLIVTTASSSELQTAADRVYRFFPRSEEEAKTLAKEAKRLGIKRVSFIATDNQYGHDAVRLWTKNWSGDGAVLVQGIFLDSTLSTEAARERIMSSKLPAMDIDGLLLVHSENITEGLLKLKKGIKFLTFASYHPKYFRDQIGTDFTREQWVVPTPDYKVNREKLKNMNAGFLYLTLDKLIHSIEATADKPDGFHDEWMSEKYPPIVRFERDGSADFNIHMRIKRSDF